jgi:nucleoid-associated protein YgaU
MGEPIVASSRSPYQVRMSARANATIGRAVRVAAQGASMGRLPSLGALLVAGVLVASCGGGTGAAPPTPTMPPTVVQLPSIPRPPLDTPVAQASAVAAQGVVHVVGPNENLGSIALHYYGDANQWQRIYDVNRNVIPNPNDLTIGTRLSIPPP